MALVNYGNSAENSPGPGTYGSAPASTGSGAKTGSGGRVKPVSGLWSAWAKSKSLGASSSTTGDASTGSDSGGDTSIAAIKRHQGRSRGGGRQGGRSSGQAQEGGGLSPLGRAVAGAVVGAVLGKAFDLPGTWLVGGVAGGAVGYWGGDLWTTR